MAPHADFYNQVVRPYIVVELAKRDSPYWLVHTETGRQLNVNSITGSLKYWCVRWKGKLATPTAGVALC